MVLWIFKDTVGDYSGQEQFTKEIVAKFDACMEDWFKEVAGALILFTRLCWINMKPELVAPP